MANVNMLSDGYITSPTMPSSVLLVEALVGVAHARVEPVVALGDALVGRRVVEAVAGDAEAADRDRERVGQHEPVAAAGP